MEVETVTDELRASDAWKRVSPAGKVPVLANDDVTIFESRAMVDFLLERYGNGRLQPKPGTAESALYHQWMWFSEATLIRPLGLYSVLKSDGDAATLSNEAKAKFYTALQVVEEALDGNEFLLDDFSAADIMMGYSIAIVERLLADSYPNSKAYLGRLQRREAFQRVMAL